MLPRVGRVAAEDAERGHLWGLILVGMIEHGTQGTQKTQPKNGEPVEIPIPKRSAFEELVRKVTGVPAGRKRPAGTDEPHEQSD